MSAINFLFSPVPLLHSLPLPPSCFLALRTPSSHQLNTLCVSVYVCVYTHTLLYQLRLDTTMCVCVCVRRAISYTGSCCVGGSSAIYNIQYIHRVYKQHTSITHSYGCMLLEELALMLAGTRPFSLLSMLLLLPAPASSHPWATPEKRCYYALLIADFRSSPRCCCFCF